MYDSEQKAELLNEYFSSITYLVDENAFLPLLSPQIEHQLDNIVISSDDVKNILLNLDVTRGTGPGSTGPKLLREGASVLSPTLAQFFNLSLQIATFLSS